MPSNPFAAERERRQGGNPFTVERQRRQPQVNVAGVPIPRNLKNLKEEDFSAIGRAAVTRIIDAVANVPEILHDFRPLNIATLPPNVRAQRNIDIPTGEQAIAALDALLQTPRALLSDGAPIGTRMEQSLQRGQELAEANPVATGVGEVGGDIMTLITGRAPVADLVRRAEQRLAPRAADLFFGKVPRVLEPGIRRTVDRALNSTAVRRLARGAGRSVETGLEGAILEILKGENADPLEAAAFASGGQMVGSLLLEGGKGLLSGGVLRAGAKVSIAAASIAGLWQLGKSATPGGRDRILESIETGYDKVTYSLMLGALAAMAGAGRGRSGKLAEDLPKVVDAIATLPRGLSLSLITDIAEMDPEEQAKAEKALNSLARNPEYKGRDETERRIIEKIRGFSSQSESGGDGL